MHRWLVSVSGTARRKKSRKTSYLYCNSCFYFLQILILEEFWEIRPQCSSFKKYVDHRENIAFLSVLVKDLLAFFYVLGIDGYPIVYNCFPKCFKLKIEFRDVWYIYSYFRPIRLKRIFGSWMYQLAIYVRRLIRLTFWWYLRQIFYYYSKRGSAFKSPAY
jgi:hypothetical protein